MIHDIVLMAKSKKGDDGYCVAGIDLDTDEWIRLNVKGEYSVPRHLFSYPDGIEPEVLDVFSINLTEKDERCSWQPENWFCDINTLAKSKRELRDEVKNRIIADQNKYEKIFYNNQHFVLTSELMQLDDDLYSLHIVVPQNVTFTKKSSGKIAASFSYKGNVYSNLRVTDMEFLQAFNNSRDGEVYSINKQFIFVLSIGTSFQNMITRQNECWKFVAKVIPYEQIFDEYAVEQSQPIIEKAGIDVGALAVVASQSPGHANFENFDELREYLEKGLKTYNNTNYSVDNIEDARRDLAVLKAVKKKLTDKRKQLEKAYMMPIEEVINQMDYLIDLVKEPYNVIDRVIKNNTKAVKEREIMNYATQHSAPLGNYAGKVLLSSAFFNSRWLNSTYSEKNWKHDVDEIINSACKDIQYIIETGGSNTNAILAFYFDKLSFSGIEAFMKTLTKADEQKEDTIEGAIRIIDPAGNMIIDPNTGEVLKDAPDEQVLNADNQGICETETGIWQYKIVKVLGKEKDIVDYLSNAQLCNLQVTVLDEGVISKQK